MFTEKFVRVWTKCNMSEGKVCKWVWEFKNGRENVHNELRSGLTVCCLGWSGFCFWCGNSWRQKINNNESITTVSSSVKVSALQNCVWKLEFSKVVRFMGPKAYWSSQKKRFGCALNFLGQCDEEGDDMLNRIVLSQEIHIHNGSIRLFHCKSPPPPSYHPFLHSPCSLSISAQALWINSSRVNKISATNVLDKHFLKYRYAFYC